MTRALKRKVTRVLFEAASWVQEAGRGEEGTGRERLQRQATGGGGGGARGSRQDDGNKATSAENGMTGEHRRHGEDHGRESRPSSWPTALLSCLHTARGHDFMNAEGARLSAAASAASRCGHERRAFPSSTRGPTFPGKR
ncbi:unnamed protein product [Lampetra planeri]